MKTSKIFSRDLLSKLLKFAVAFGLIFFMAHRGLFDPKAFSALLKPQYLIPSLVLVGLNLLFVNFRWVVLLKSGDFAASFKVTFPIQLIGVFFNYALPGAVGGDVMKAYYLAQDNPQRKMDAVTSVVVDRILGLYAWVLMAVLAVLFNLSIILANQKLMVIGAFTVLVWLLMSVFLAAAFSRRVRALSLFEVYLRKLPLGGSLLRAYDAIHIYHKKPAVIWMAIFYSVLSQVAAMAFIFLVAVAVGETSLPLGTYFFAVPIGFIVAALPISPAGIGVGQVAFLVLFQLYSGQSSVLGQTAITAFQVILLLWGLLGAYFYMQRKKPEVIPQQEVA